LLNDDAQQDWHFPVTPNLYAALEQLGAKPELGGAWLWIDAICIDQQSTDEDGEKSAQIKRMPDIYSFAKKVLVWLNPSADESNLAMDNMRALVDALGPARTR
jgi:hypothetical protein